MTLIFTQSGIVLPLSLQKKVLVRLILKILLVTILNLLVHIYTWAQMTLLNLLIKYKRTDLSADT